MNIIIESIKKTSLIQLSKSTHSFVFKIIIIFHEFLYYLKKSMKSIHFKEISTLHSTLFFNINDDIINYYLPALFIKQKIELLTSGENSL